MSLNPLNLLRSPAAKAENETIALLNRTLELISCSALGKLQRVDIMREAVRRAAHDRGTKKVPKAIIEMAKRMVGESIVFSHIDRFTDDSASLSPIEVAEIRTWCHDIETVVFHLEDYVTALLDSVSATTGCLLASLSNEELAGSDEGYPIALFSVMRGFHKLCETLIDETNGANEALYDRYGTPLFPGLCANLDRNMKKIVGLAPDEEWGSKTRKLPTDLPTHTEREIMLLFMKNTPFFSALNGKTKFRINPQARLEHTHIIGASGAGKTQLLQHMICNDLESKRRENLSIILLDSEGEFIDKVLRHPDFDPNSPARLYEKLRIFDPRKPDGVPGFNLFEGAGQLHTMSAAEQDALINRCDAICCYALNALQGTPMTGQQQIVFSELIRMLFYYPGADWEVLNKCLLDADYANLLAENAPDDVKNFFATQYDKAFKDRRAEVAARLRGLIRNSTIKGMLQSKQGKFDFLKSIDAGEILIIRADKDFFGSEMATFFGRLMIAMIHQAVLSRKKSHPVPCYFYIDEAWEYLGDERIRNLYAEARKRSVGLILAHHTFAQTSADFRSIIQTSTSIKIAGRVNRDDARTMGGYMNCDPEMLLHMQKVDFAYSEFAVHVENQTPKALVLRIPHGTLEKVPGRLSQPVTKAWKQKGRSPAPPILSVANSGQKQTKPTPNKGHSRY